MAGSEETPHFRQSPRNDDLEDIEILKNLLELRTRLRQEKPHLETDLD